MAASFLELLTDEEARKQNQGGTTGTLDLLQLARNFTKKGKKEYATRQAAKQQTADTQLASQRAQQVVADDTRSAYEYFTNQNKPVAQGEIQSKKDSSALVNESVHLGNEAKANNNFWESQDAANRFTRMGVWSLAQEANVQAERNAESQNNQFLTRERNNVETSLADFGLRERDLALAKSKMEADASRATAQNNAAAILGLAGDPYLSDPSRAQLGNMLMQQLGFTNASPLTYSSGGGGGDDAGARAFAEMSQQFAQRNNPQTVNTNRTPPVQLQAPAAAQAPATQPFQFAYGQPQQQPQQPPAPQGGQPPAAVSVSDLATILNRANQQFSEQKAREAAVLEEQRKARKGVVTPPYQR